MLTRINELPTDRRIAGVHVVPVTADGAIVMGWHRERKMLETIGGRIEPGESLEEALKREAREEAGLTLVGPYIPFARLYWESTDTYTVWFLAKVAAMDEIPAGFETAGRVIFNIETAKALISFLHHDPGKEQRLMLLTWAEELKHAQGDGQ